ncbi:MAG: pilus assembly protein PilP [Deltaproteobacteria bacterium]|nr:pilus assembly protein PilP [Deltaproteobacteria bacterium]
MRITAMALAIALLALPGCQEDATVGPTVAEFSEARRELVTKLKKGKVKKVKTPPAGERVVTPKAEDTTFLAMEGSLHYNALGKRDPFRSFEWEQLRLDLGDGSMRGPLEQFDVNQLSLIGVVWNANNARALIQDPSGMSYIVAEGAKIGKNSGRVTSIDDNLVVVKETYVDLNLEETTKDIEMRIRATEGG